MTEPTASLYKPVPFSSMMDGPYEIDWLVERVMPKVTTGIVAGEPGIGKTWIVMDLVLALASGVKWLGKFETKPCKILVVDEENASVLIRQRFHSLKWLYEPYGMLDNVEFLVGESIDITPLEHKMKGLQPSSDYLMLYNTIGMGEYDVVVFDSLTRMHHADENDSSRMSAVFGYVKRLMDEFGVSCLFTHHFNKGRGHSNNRLRGSSDILAFPDYVLRVETDRSHTGLSESGVVMEHGKSRWGANVGKVSVKLENAPTEAGARVKNKRVTLIGESDLEAALLVYLGVARTKEDVVGEMQNKGLGTVAQIERKLYELVKRREVYKPSRGIYQISGASQIDELDILAP